MGAVKITTVFDNTSLNPNCTPEWGFAAVLELPKETILFDTGNDGQILLDNLTALGFGETTFSTVVISHMHWDHTGGLTRVIQANPEAVVYLPGTAQEVEKFKKVVLVKAPQQIADAVFTLGEMPGPANEQSIAIRTTDGLVIITGCAHPGIVDIVKAGREQFPDDSLHLVMGGFHLNRHSKKQVLDIISTFKALGVQYVSPTHCTGENAISLFKQEYAEKFITPGVGLSLEFSLLE
ncbi:MBL fold metallo-hydrolase [candidate division KSB1 bacterium]|nr:MBL fold metallo-hydrolase [candidate division KSB1 bacterium]